MKCLRCGRCCFDYDVVIAVDPALGLVDSNLRVKPRGEPCPHFRGDKAGKYSCAVHGEPWYPLTRCALFAQVESRDEDCRIGASELKRVAGLRISVAIIARNEEPSIARCLKSVADADEIVVVDTGSEDRTVEVVKEYTDKVYDFKWTDDFAAARNFALSKCTGDWILTIDADNELVPGIEAARAAAAEAQAQGAKTVSVRINTGRSNTFSHYLPLLYRRDPEIFWKGAVHNYLSRDDKRYSTLALNCWHSPSHKVDPDRTLRILKREVAEKPNLVREKFYLAREFLYRSEWERALYWYREYLKVATYGEEIADAYLMMSRCLWQLQKGDEARRHCAAAISLNANFREAILFLAEMSGPRNRDRWLLFAETADNSGVLFNREKTEWDAGMYDTVFKRDADVSRYEAIYQETARIVGDDTVLDIGCGVAGLSKYVPNYHGFDFSAEADRIGNHPGCWVGNVYDRESYREDAEWYVLTEVLEHVDDLRVIEGFEVGQKVVFTVPSFNDAAHLRFYTEDSMRRRFGSLLEIKRVVRFNLNAGRWDAAAPSTNSYILLVEAMRK